MGVFKFKNHQLTNYSILDTHPKQLEAEQGAPYCSSGTSDEVYVIPEHSSSSSHDVPFHVIHNNSHGTHKSDDVIHRIDDVIDRTDDGIHKDDTCSPLHSLNDSSIPAGITTILKLSKLHL